MATSNPTHFHKTTLCIYIYSNTQFQSVSLQNIINNSTCTNVRRILICSSVLHTCTWKIVFKIENNELNELSECMFYKMFPFSCKYLKTIKFSFTRYFPEALFAYFKVSKTFCTCLLLKVYKTFNTCLLLKVYKIFNICLLACLLCFSLKAYKTLIAYLLRSL